MADRLEDFEDVSRYPIEEAARDALLAGQRECAVVWSTRDGWPVGVMHLYLWHEGRFWVTCTARRKRVAALRARPESCVIVAFSEERTLTARTLAIVHATPSEHARWFYPALARQVLAEQPESVRREGVEGFVARLESDDRVILELVPHKWISFDGRKVKAHAAGLWQPGRPWLEPGLS
ncbi:hypothetical protein K2X89_01740 [Myxococcota bacterium]|nr:hypothetical protein [Myxococcota bacterium]